jgi:hypothetical protein
MFGERVVMKLRGPFWGAATGATLCLAGILWIHYLRRGWEHTTFHPDWEEQRPGLLVLGGSAILLGANNAHGLTARLRACFMLHITAGRPPSVSNVGHNERQRTSSLARVGSNCFFPNSRRRGDSLGNILQASSCLYRETPDRSLHVLRVRTVHDLALDSGSEQASPKAR